MLKANGITKLLTRWDWPRFVEKVPQAYSSDELKRFFEVCDHTQHVLFEFFLRTGFREEEVQCTMWKDISLQEHTARVTAKARLGFIPKTWEEREVLIPDHLVEVYVRTKEWNGQPEPSLDIPKLKRKNFSSLLS